MSAVVSPGHQGRAIEIKSLLGAYSEAEDLINIGAYAAGSNPQIDLALKFIEPINGFLQQDADEGGDFESHVQRLMGLLEAQPAAEERA